jgi:hypothetical protein
MGFSQTNRDSIIMLNKQTNPTLLLNSATFMEEIGKYLQVINDNIFIVIVLIIFFTSCLMIGIEIGKWLYRIFKKYCL